MIYFWTDILLEDIFSWTVVFANSIYHDIEKDDRYFLTEITIFTWLSAAPLIVATLRL